MKKHTKVEVAALLERIKSEGPDAVISRAEATALIASRTMDGRDTVRSARNRVGTQLSRAADLGRAGQDIFSGGILPLPDGTYTADELGRWANRKHDNKFPEMPRTPRVCSTDCEEKFGLSAKPEPIVLPGDIPRLQAMVLQLLAENKSGESKLRQAREERNRALGKRFASGDK